MTAFHWTEERVKELHDLWDGQGLSSGAIAKVFGISRNSVIGKANREGLVGYRSKLPKETSGTVVCLPRTATVVSAEPTQTVGTSGPASPPPPTTPAVVPSVAVPPAPPPSPVKVTVLDLRDFMCRWPIGNPGTPEFRFCAERKASHGPYCPHHAAVSLKVNERADRGERLVVPAALGIGRH